jgi:hypothetical protein
MAAWLSTGPPGYIAAQRETDQTEPSDAMHDMQGFALQRPKLPKDCAHRREGKDSGDHQADEGRSRLLQQVKVLIGGEGACCDQQIEHVEDQSAEE